MRPISSHYHKGGPTVTIVRDREMRSIGIASPHGHYPGSAPIPAPARISFSGEVLLSSIDKDGRRPSKGPSLAFELFPKVYEIQASAFGQNYHLGDHGHKRGFERLAFKAKSCSV
jgi:hypothetical protein